jgi:hypothetical protein
LQEIKGSQGLDNKSRGRPLLHGACIFLSLTQ